MMPLAVVGIDHLNVLWVRVVTMRAVTSQVPIVSLLDLDVLVAELLMAELPSPRYLVLVLASRS